MRNFSIKNRNKTVVENGYGNKIKRNFLDEIVIKSCRKIESTEMQHIGSNRVCVGHNVAFATNLATLPSMYIVCYIKII